ncbi:29016_t:CDS:10, partial [Racocetra persica]
EYKSHGGYPVTLNELCYSYNQDSETYEGNKGLSVLYWPYLFGYLARAKCDINTIREGTKGRDKTHCSGDYQTLIDMTIKDGYKVLKMSATFPKMEFSIDSSFPRTISYTDGFLPQMNKESDIEEFKTKFEADLKKAGVCYVFLDETLQDSARDISFAVENALIFGYILIDDCEAEPTRTITLGSAVIKACLGKKNKEKSKSDTTDIENTNSSLKDPELLRNALGLPGELFGKEPEVILVGLKTTDHIVGQTKDKRTKNIYDIVFNSFSATVSNQKEFPDKLEINESLPLIENSGITSEEVKMILNGIVKKELVKVHEEAKIAYNQNNVEYDSDKKDVFAKVVALLRFSLEVNIAVEGKELKIINIVDKDDKKQKYGNIKESRRKDFPRLATIKTCKDLVALSTYSESKTTREFITFESEIFLWTVDSTLLAELDKLLAEWRANTPLTTIEEVLCWERNYQLLKKFAKRKVRRLENVEKDIENHQYTFFPLTLSSHPEEKEKIIPLLNKIFEELPTIRDIIPKSTQLNEHDCGVYLIKYIEHLLKENGLWGDSLQDFEITQQDIIEFRSMANEAIKEEIQKLKEKYVKLEERINNILSENGVENDIKLSEFINNLKVGIDQKEEKIAQLQEQINENQKTDDDKIAKLKRELAQKENQLAQTIKDFQEKEQTQKQEYLQLLTKKDQG